jgi:hypothetical protein
LIESLPGTIAGQIAWQFSLRILLSKRSAKAFKLGDPRQVNGVYKKFRQALRSIRRIWKHYGCQPDQVSAGTQKPIPSRSVSLRATRFIQRSFGSKTIPAICASRNMQRA